MKKKISEFITGYLVKHTGNEEKIEKFSEFIEEFFEKIPEDYSDLHTDFYTEIEDFTEEIDEEMMIEIVESFHHKDGTHIGAKWSFDEVNAIVKQYDIKNKIEACGKEFCPHKFWVAINYVFAVHYSINRTINGYIDLAIDEYCNKNICFDRVIKTIFSKI